MINNWTDLLLHAGPLINFLSQDEFFSREYHGTAKDRLVLTDVVAAKHYATDDSFDAFDEWQTVSDAPEVFPESCVLKPWL